MAAPDESFDGVDRFDPKLDRACDEFEAEWHAEWHDGAEPVIDRYVMRFDQSLRRDLLMELVAIDIESRIKRRSEVEWVSLETHRTRWPELGPAHQLPTDLIAMSYQGSRLAGQTISADDVCKIYGDRNGELIAALRRVDEKLDAKAVASEAGCQPSTSNVPHVDIQSEVVPRKGVQQRGVQGERLQAIQGDSYETESFVRSNSRVTQGRDPRRANDLSIVASDSLGEFGSDRSDAVDSAAHHLTLGQTLGRFTLEERLGTGSFGIVWKAMDNQLRRIVALKFPRSDLPSEYRETAFLQEARVAAQSQHPYVVRVHEIGRDDGLEYIVTDYIDGPDLATWLHDAAPRLDDAVEFCAKVAEALEHSHALGIVHRDLKPANILLKRNDQGDFEPRVTDFGLALSYDEDSSLEGAVLGSPAYMSPEQAKGRSDASDRRSDIFSLGIILFELTTGERPFRGSRSAILDQIIHAPAPDPRSLNRAVNSDLRTICMKCLEKTPQRRYATAKELADDLRRYLRREPIVARPIGPVERAWRTAKRNPVVSTLTLGLMVALVVGMSVAIWQRGLAEVQAERMRWNLYSGQMNLVQRAWEQGNYVVGREILRSHLPSEGQVDLRDFAWHHWWHRFHQSEKLADLKTPRYTRHRVALSDDGNWAVVFGTKELWLVSRVRGGQTVSTSDAERRLPEHLDNRRLTRDTQRIPAKADAAKTDAVKTDAVKTGAVKTGDTKLASQRLTETWQAATFLSDDSLLAVSSLGELWYWDLKHNRSRQLTRFDNVLTQSEFSRDGRRVAIGLSGGVIEVLGIDSQTLKVRRLARLNENGLPVEILAFSPDHNRIGYATSDSRIHAAEIDSSRRRKTRQSHQAVRDLCWSPDSQVLASVGVNSDVDFWTLDTGEVRQPVQQDWLGFYSISFAGDGESFFVSGSDTFIQQFDRSTGALMRRFLGHERDVTDVALSAPGQDFVSVSDTGAVRQWHVNDDRYVFPLEGPSDSVKGLRFTHDGRRLISVGYDSCLTVIDTQTRETIHRVAHAEQMMAVDVSPDDNVVATADRGGNVTIWNLEAGQPLRTLRASVGALNSVAISANGRQVAAGGDRGQLFVWELATGHEVAKLQAHQGEPVFAIDYDPSGRYLASGGWDGHTRLWDAKTYRPIGDLYEQSQRVLGVRFSPDGQLLATSEDVSLRLWRTETFEDETQPASIAVLRGHYHFVNHPDFSSDGTTLASGSWDGSVKLWDLRTFSEKTSFAFRANCVAFSPNGRWLVAGGTSTPPLLRVWCSEQGTRDSSETGLTQNDD